MHVYFPPYLSVHLRILYFTVGYYCLFDTKFFSILTMLCKLFQYILVNINVFLYISHQHFCSIFTMSCKLFMHTVLDTQTIFSISRHIFIKITKSVQFFFFFLHILYLTFKLFMSSLCAYFFIRKLYSLYISKHFCRLIYLTHRQYFLCHSHTTCSVYLLSLSNFLTLFMHLILNTSTLLSISHHIIFSILTMLCKLFQYILVNISVFLCISH